MNLPAGEASKDLKQPSAGTADTRMLDYCLKETAVGVRAMHQNRSSMHAFDYGTTPDGKKHVFFMAILPQEIFDALPIKWRDSVSANESAGSHSDSPEAKAK